MEPFITTESVGMADLKNPFLQSNKTIKTMEAKVWATPPNTLHDIVDFNLSMLDNWTYLHDAYFNETPQENYPSHTKDCTLFMFIFFSIFVGALCILGILGNTVSIFVLQKDKSGGTVHAATYLLQALAVADNAVLTFAFIVLSIMYGFLPFVNAHDIILRAKPFILKYVTPLAHMAQTATVWMTVLLAVNRYIAICRPFDVYKRSSKKMARIQVVIVYVFAVLFNFPRFFQYEIIYTTDVDGNQTYLPIYVRETSIGPKSTFGKVYTNGLYTAIVLILPIIILIILNSKLIIELRRMSKRRVNISKQRQSDENLTLIMIIVIVIFIACNLPDRINEIGKVEFVDRRQCELLWVIDCICTALITLNSSTNFLVYYIFRRRFRHILFHMLCGRRGSQDGNNYDMDHIKYNGHHNDVLLSSNGLAGSKTLTTSVTCL